jgi:hypothetical protein
VRAESDDRQLKIARESPATLLRAKRSIVRAAIYSPDGAVFASYSRDPAAVAALPRFRVDEERAAFESGRLRIFQRILLEQQLIGGIYLESDLGEVYSKLRQFVLIVILTLIVALLLALLLSGKLQTVISEPIARLASRRRAPGPKASPLYLPLNQHPLERTLQPAFPLLPGWIGQSTFRPHD